MINFVVSFDFSTIFSEYVMLYFESEEGNYGLN